MTSTSSTCRTRGSGRAGPSPTRRAPASSDGDRRAARRSRCRGGRDLQPAGRACRAGARGRRGGQAGDLLREADRARPIADADRGDRRVPRGRHPAPRGHESSLRPRVGEGQASPRRDRRPGRAISVTMALPPNGRYHDVVTEIGAPSGHRPRSRRPRPGEPAVAASVVRQLLTGLAVHDLPLLRDLAPRVRARRVRPGGRADRLRRRVPRDRHPGPARDGHAPGRAPTRCGDSTITTERERLDVSFPPAFVHAGSARVRVRFGRRARDRRIRTIAEDGYIAEWRALAELLASGMPSSTTSCSTTCGTRSVSRMPPRPSSERRHERPDRRSLAARVLRESRPPSFRSALGSRASPRTRSSSCAVPGNGATPRAERCEPGAVGIVVSRPRGGALGRARRARSSCRGSPVVVERPLLRADVEGSIAARSNTVRAPCAGRRLSRTSRWRSTRRCATRSAGSGCSRGRRSSCGRGVSSWPRARSARCGRRSRPSRSSSPRSPALRSPVASASRAWA